MVGNILVFIHTLAIHLWSRNKLFGRDGPDPPKIGTIKLGIDTVIRNLVSIKSVPSYRSFLLACLFHRQSSGMFSDLIVPVLSILQVNSLVFNVGAVGVFITRGLGSPIWYKIDKAFSLGAKNVISINQFLLGIFCILV